METSVFIAKRNIFGYFSSSFAANLLKINANIAKITYPAAMTVRMFFVISTPVDGFTFELLLNVNFLCIKKTVDKALRNVL